MWKGYIPEFAGLTNGISQLTKLIDERVKLPHHEDYRTKMSKLSQEMQRVDNSYFASKRDYACERADIIRAFEKGENETVLHYQSQQREINEEKRKLEERLAADNDKKLLSVHEWLAFNRFAHTDHKRYQSIRGVYLATAQWILNEGLVNDWIAAEIPNSASESLFNQRSQKWIT